MTFSIPESSSGWPRFTTYLRSLDKSSSEVLDLGFINKELQNYVKSKEDYRIHFGVFESQLRWDNFKKKCPSDKLQALKGKYLEFCDIVGKITELHGSKLNESCLFMFQQALDTYTGKGAVLRLYPNLPSKDWESITQLATILNAYYSTIEAPLSHIPKSNKPYGIHLPYICPHTGVPMNQISTTSSEDSNEISTNQPSDGMSISEVQSIISNSSNISNPAYIQQQQNQQSQSQQQSDFLYDIIQTYIMEQNLDIPINELITDIVHILESSPNSEVLQEPLVNLLGFHFELIQTLIESRDYILDNYHNNNNNQYKPVISPPSVTLPSYTVTTESEIRQRKEEHKRWKKQLENKRNPLLDAGLDPSQLHNENQLGLNKYLPHPKPYTPYMPGVHLDDSTAFKNHNKTVLPTNSTTTETPNSTEIVIPPVYDQSSSQNIRLVSIDELEDYAQIPFQNIQYFNRLQSWVFNTAYKTDENLLICAPTGAGKTNVALLTILREIKKNIINGCLHRSEFKIIYVAPMKALAQEIVTKFDKQLNGLGLNVKELTGDMQLTRTEIAETQIIVTTPEKFDVMTRKASSDDSFVSLVRVLILDEVHLLASDRGNVIESIVARILRLVESSQSPIRIVGLSATLPNYKDVADFLRVNPARGLFHCDSSFRPVPLTQIFIGVYGENRNQINDNMNDIAYDKCLKCLESNKQVMIFVHSRRETKMTAESLIQHILNNDGSNNKNILELFKCENGYNLYKSRIIKSKDENVKELVKYGIGIHHAGMLRQDRNLIEDMFSRGALKVICCTSTLAWGVNLPARTVIIKGTNIYSSEKGSYIDLDILDVLQIFGRAGRPQYDNQGEGIIITEHKKLSHYVSLLTNQIPISSKFAQSLPDHLNAEIVSGTVTNIEEAITWFKYTYYYIHMRSSPRTYAITDDEFNFDPTLTHFCEEMIREGVKRLEESQMVRFESKSGNLSRTELGRIASFYYINYETIRLYNERIDRMYSYEDMFFTISESQEFKNIIVRDEEERELSELEGERFCKFDSQNNNSTDCPYAKKVNILLQSYISRAEIQSFTLLSDMQYIQQNSARFFRALFEIFLKQKSFYQTICALNICKSIDRRIWYDDHPLKQIPQIDDHSIRKIHNAHLTLDQLNDMESYEITNIIGVKDSGKKIKHYLDQFPYLDIQTSIKPITTTVLQIQVKYKPIFTWNDNLHGGAIIFWFFIFDRDNDFIHHYEQIILRKVNYSKDLESEISFYIPIPENRSTQYYIQVISDNWIGIEQLEPLNVGQIVVPNIESTQTNLLDLFPLPITALHNKDYESIYNFSHFNPVQTQVFYTCYNTDNSVLVGAPTGSGKTLIAELCLFRLFSKYPKSKAVYIGPLKALIRERVEDWKEKFDNTSSNNNNRKYHNNLHKKVVELTGDITPDLNIIEKSDVIVTTPEKWDAVSRLWNKKKYVQKVNLVIIDEIHFLGQDRGPIIESIVSRMRNISSTQKTPIRFVGLSTAVANAKDLAEWLGIPNTGLYNFRPSVRPVPIDVHISGYPNQYYCPRMATMNKPAYMAIKTYSPHKPTIIFVASRRQTRLTAFGIISLATQDNPYPFRRLEQEELEYYNNQIQDETLKQTLSFGIGVHHAGLSNTDRGIVEKLFREERIQIVCTTSTLAWGINLPAHLVIIKGTEYHDTKTSNYIDMPLTDVLQMMGRAGRPQYDSKGIACVFVYEPKKTFYYKFLYEPFPVESSLHKQLSDFLNAEIANRTIKSVKDIYNYLTWTFFYRRLIQNPIYYGAEGTEINDIQKCLTDIITKSLEELQTSKCIIMSGINGNIEPTVLGEIACQYYLKHQTLSLYQMMLPHCITLQDHVHLLSQSTEYNDSPPVRHNENLVNEEIAKLLPWSIYPNETYDSNNVKAYLLFVSHFVGIKFPVMDYNTDQVSVLDQSMRMVMAMIDVAVENNWTNHIPVLITVSRMIVQGCMDDVHIFSQINGMNNMTIHTLQENGINNWNDLFKLSLDDFTQITKHTLPRNKIEQIYKSIEVIPNLKVDLMVTNLNGEQPEVSPDDDCILLEIGKEYNLVVTIDFVKPLPERLKTLKYKKLKPYSWWIMLLCDEKVLCIKRCSTYKHMITTVKFEPPNTSDELMSKRFTCKIVSDSIFGVEYEEDFDVWVKNV